MIGAAGFASKGVFAKLLYAEGWGADAVLLTRSCIALPIIGVWAVRVAGVKRLLSPPPRALVGAFISGTLCYYVGALLDFKALEMIHASVERVLLFSYPSIIVVLHSILYRTKPSRTIVLALALTYAGILMVVTGLDLSLLRGNLPGATLVLAAAVTSALYYLAGDRWTPTLGSVTFTFYALCAATGCLITHSLLLAPKQPIVWTGHGVLLMACLVAFATVIPMLAMAEGVRRLGAPRASIISTIGPPITIFLGNWLLTERLTIPQWVGVGLIVVGILTLELRKGAAGRR
jgi:drug/metabolite transporter (DMT)-like permease